MALDGTAHLAELFPRPGDADVYPAITVVQSDCRQAGSNSAVGFTGIRELGHEVLVAHAQKVQLISYDQRNRQQQIEFVIKKAAPTRPAGHTSPCLKLSLKKFLESLLISSNKM
jgi:hypothetical protein